MGWKVNLQPKLIAESLRKEAWTIGLAGKRKIKLNSVSLFELRFQIFSWKYFLT